MKILSYIDPGTGSMLFAVLVGIVGIAGYFFKGLWLRLRFFLTGGKKTDDADEVIPFVIYSDDKRYWTVFEPICRELDRQGFDVVYMTSSSDDPALQSEYEHVKAEYIGKGNKAFVKLNFLKATILLSTTPGLDVYQWRRSENVKYYVHIPHMPGELTTYRMFGIDYYDALLLSAQYQIDDVRALEALRGLPEKECKIVGIPYLDEKVKRLKATTCSDHKCTVLVAPSWGPNSLLNRFGNRLIDELVSTGYHIIIRPHPQSFASEKELIDRLMADYPELEWNQDVDNYDVLSRSDVMISDFSGVIFDYSFVFDKPVICAYTDFDKAPYDAWWLDTPIWTATAIPRIGPILDANGIGSIKQMIDSALEDKGYEEGRRLARDETWSNRGTAACLAAEYIVKKYNELSVESEVVTNNSTAANVETEIGTASMPEEVQTESQRALEQGKQCRVNFSIVLLIVAGTIAIGAVFGVRAYLSVFTEKELERSDIELMRTAEATGKIKLKKKAVEEQSSYWINAKTLELLPVEFDKPSAYGCGTSQIGGATKAYYEDGILLYDYDESVDYTDKIIMVTINPETDEVSLKWVDSD